MSQRAMLAAMVGLLMLGTGCPHTYRKGGKLDRAMQKDTDERFEQREAELKSLELEDEEEDERICPHDKVEYRDCQTLPCKVTCQ
ncbi:hypothetical protein [Archangium sp.]|uniref:hypothetical protein n=1 Tax=Archangium sp. TaxID=1872627 RepID=UPI002D6E13D5|nr:hypothetical protein [Archangium sp.]HYO56374.1 hypothetical protein [Archangium sp.]